MLIGLIISGVINVLLLYGVYNSIVKIERYEDAVTQQNATIENIINTINETDEFLKTIDEKGHFQSDDEVGKFFEGLKTIQDTLNQYSSNQPNAEKEE